MQGVLHIPRHAATKWLIPEDMARSQRAQPGVRARASRTFTVLLFYSCAFYGNKGDAHPCAAIVTRCTRPSTLLLAMERAQDYLFRTILSISVHVERQAYGEVPLPRSGTGSAFFGMPARAHSSRNPRCRGTT